MRKNRRALIGLAIAALLLVSVLALPSLAGLWVDLRWFGALGHGDVLTTPLWTRLGLGASVGVVAAALIAGTLRLAVHLSRGCRPPPPLLVGDATRPVALHIDRVVPRFALPVGALAGLAMGLSAAAHWRDWLLLAHGQPFGELDPIFGRDVGFYVFTMPFLDTMHGWIVAALVLALVLSAGMYFARGAISLPQGRLSVSRAARVHLSVIASLLFLALAFGAWLASAALVLSNDGLVAGASYADVHARLPMIRAHVAVAIVAAVLVALSAARRRLTFAAAAVVLYAAVGILGRGAYPLIIQSYVVGPNELERERPYLQHEIAATRAAYDLADLGTRELSGDPRLTWAQIEEHQQTLDNIRLWDHRPLLDTFGQIQEIRTYYDFVSIDNDRYVIDGSLRQTMLSPRELSSESLPNRTWINEHFTFTHGYGLTLGPVNEADEEGLPVLFVRDIPPASRTGTVRVTRPQIYFGERTDAYVFVDTPTREFDHPSGEGNVYASYEGEDGIELGSVLLRAALAIHLGNLKIALADDVSGTSRVLLHRNVLERATRLAPFLRFDHDPYMVVREDGSLAWILDAYTETSRYPYARSAGTPALNYVRNSVKAVIDAYDGTVRFYIADDDDPILATWRAVFPGLLRPLSEMPADLRAHLRYPLDIFHVQARMLATYHMDSPELLYNREDQWQIPSTQGREGAAPMEPYYTVMRLPGEAEAEFILMLPFTPARKDNLAAWMVARNDGPRLGELLVYELPNDRLVYGPQQVLNRINQDADISQQLSLWDQRGSEAHLGTLVVVPIEESLLYVLPLYLRSAGGRIPQLKRVIVVHENQIAMAETLEAAVAQVFGRTPAPRVVEADDASRREAAPPEAASLATTGEGPAPEAATGAPAVEVEPRVAALQHFERAVAAQRRGDWATYGDELAALERVLEAMQPASVEGSTP